MTILRSDSVDHVEGEWFRVGPGSEKWGPHRGTERRRCRRRRECARPFLHVQGVSHGSFVFDERSTYSLPIVEIGANIDPFTWVLLYSQLRLAPEVLRQILNIQNAFSYPSSRTVQGDTN